jgi:hypothetical protein
MRLGILALLFFAAPAGAEECRPIAGSDALFESRTVVVLGEWHGTVETPEALYRFACGAAARKLSVVVGYEMGSEQQKAIDGFFQNGDPAPLTTTQYGFGGSDGRGSRAMLDLLRRLKALRDAGADVRFQALIIGREEAKNDEEKYYEGGMAVRAAEAWARPNTFVVLSAGENHTVSKEDYGIGARLRKRGLPVLALQVTTSGGNAWYCDAGLSCRANDVPADDKRAPWTVRKGGSPDGRHDGTLGVGRMHASPPLRSQ